MIRHDWSDILDNGANASLQSGNIQGATFSYSDDEVANNRTYSAVGAAIASLTWMKQINDARGWHVLQSSIGPYAAIDRVSNSAKTTNNVNNLYFGVGAGISLLHSQTNDPLESPHLIGLEGRAAFVYETDSNFRASLPGGILELEPEYLYRLSSNNNCFLPWIALGYNNRVGCLADGTALLLFQTRAWLHLEGGDIQQNGTNWNVVNGGFFRMGPEVRGQVSVPKLNNFSISAEYDYLCTLSGASGKNYLYTLTASIPLTPEIQGLAHSQPVSLNVSYNDGGLILSKQPVKSFTVGISVIF